MHDDGRADNKLDASYYLQFYLRLFSSMHHQQKSDEISICYFCVDQFPVIGH